jgi:hypothetical protein
MAALSLSAATAFADAPPANQHGGAPQNCATAKQAAQAKLRNDQAALDAARANLNDAKAQLAEVEAGPQEGHQPWLPGYVQDKQAEVSNLQAVVQADQAGLNQTPDACKTPTGNSSPTANAPAKNPSTSKPSGATSSGSSPRAPSEAPGLPQTGARG